MDRDDVSESLVIAVSRVDDLRNLVRGFTLAEPSVDAERLPHAGRGVGDLHGRAMPRRGAEQAAGVVVSDANALNLPDILTLDVEDVLGASFKVIHRVVEGELAAVALVAKDNERDVRVAAAAANVRGDHLHYVVVHRRVAGSRGLERDSQVLVLEPVVVVKENFLPITEVGDGHHVEVPRRAHALAVDADVHAGELPDVLSLHHELVDPRALKVIGGVLQRECFGLALGTDELGRHRGVGSREPSVGCVHCDVVPARGSTGSFGLERGVHVLFAPVVVEEEDGVGFRSVDVGDLHVGEVPVGAGAAAAVANLKAGDGAHVDAPEREDILGVSIEVPVFELLHPSLALIADDAAGDRGVRAGPAHVGGANGDLILALLNRVGARG